MAIDEAVLMERVTNLVPNTLRIYKWKPSAVSVGRFQTVEKEACVQACRQHSVDIVRRMTGGGSVYHDAEGEVTYSIVVAKKDLNVDNIMGIYNKVYECISHGLRILGVISDFREGTKKACPNLTVDGRKISGSAQLHKGGVVLQHGTILVGVNLEKMFTFLRAGEKPCNEIVEIAKNRVTSLEIELGRKVPTDCVLNALIKGFAQGLKAEFVEEPLNWHEQSIVEELRREKYNTFEWNSLGETN